MLRNQNVQPSTLFEPYKSIPDEIPVIATIPAQAQQQCEQAFEELIHKNLSGAKKIAQHLYSRYPNDSMINFLLGSCCMQEEKFPEAIIYFEKSAHLYPYFSETYLKLAVLYLQDTNITDAIHCFRKVIELEEDESDDDKDTAMLANAQEALKAIEAMIKEDWKCTLDDYLRGAELFDCATELIEQERYQAALTLLQGALAVYPNHIGTHLNLARTYAKLHETPRAIEHLNKVHALEHDHASDSPVKKELAKIIAELEAEDESSQMEYDS